MRITQTMWEDFVMDPVLAQSVIMGWRLDAFQEVRLRYYWWVPDVIDISGLMTGKTLVNWIYSNLRAVLIPDQVVGVFYPSHNTGQETFWTYYDKCPGKIFQAQKGKLDKGEEDDGSKTRRSGEKKSGGTWSARFRNGNMLYLPAADIQKDSANQASKDFNTLLVDEFAMIDERSEAIDKQLTGRARRASWNEHHPVWGNHRVLTAPAKTRLHPSFARVAAAEKEVAKGNPGWAVLNMSYKDYSDLPVSGPMVTAGRGGPVGPRVKTFREVYRNEGVIQGLKTRKPRAEFVGEALGLNMLAGTGWFNEALVAGAVQLGRVGGVRVELGRGKN